MNDLSSGPQGLENHPREAKSRVSDGLTDGWMTDSGKKCQFSSWNKEFINMNVYLDLLKRKMKLWINEIFSG